MTAIRVLPAIREVLSRGGPVVALESSVLSQGLPIPANAEAARRMAAAVEGEGATPGITAVVGGTPAVGLTPDELQRFLGREGIAKVSSRDLGAAMAARRDGATTVAASLTICRAAGLRVFATGGIGGVHREPPFDESADLLELSRTPTIVVCAGAKSVLDLAATLERLETLGVAVVGYQTDELPGFLYANTGLRLPTRCDSARAIATVFRAQRQVGHPSALLVVQAPPAATALSRDEVEEAIATAIIQARTAAIRGAATTPFLLAAVERTTSGRSLSVNLSLLESNARLAAAIAVELGVSHD